MYKFKPLEANDARREELKTWKISLHSLRMKRSHRISLSFSRDMAGKLDKVNHKIKELNDKFYALDKEAYNKENKALKKRINLEIAALCKEGNHYAKELEAEHKNITDLSEEIDNQESYVAFIEQYDIFEDKAELPYIAVDNGRFKAKDNNLELDAQGNRILYLEPEKNDRTKEDKAN